MKTMIGILSAVLLVASFSTGNVFAGTKKGDVQVLSGDIVKFSDNNMVIRDKTGVDHSVLVDNDSLFLRDNKEISAADMKIGYPVKIEAIRKGEKLFVKRAHINQVLKGVSPHAGGHDQNELQPATSEPGKLDEPKNQ